MGPARCRNGVSGGWGGCQDGGEARTLGKLHAQVLQLQVLRGDRQLVQPALLLVQEVGSSGLTSQEQSHQDRKACVQGSAAALAAVGEGGYIRAESTEGAAPGTARESGKAPRISTSLPTTTATPDKHTL